MSATREQIVREAYKWLRTPYHHAADVLGHGVDCAMLLVRVFCDSGAVPSFDPRPYAQYWYMHKKEQLYLAELMKYAHEVEIPGPADIVMYRIGYTASHGVILTEPGWGIHAYALRKQVERMPIEEIGRTEGFHFHSYWSIF